MKGVPRMTAAKGVQVNERGLRIGQSHPNARLTDAEVEQLLADRGPDHAPLMSLSALATKWGMSKSGVKAIVDGKHRCQIGQVTKKAPTRKSAPKKVRVKLTVSLHARAKLHRLGGGAWLEKLLEQA